MIFPWYILLYSCSGDCLGFLKPTAWKWYGLPQVFPRYGKLHICTFTFSMFWELYRFTGKIYLDPWLVKIWVFPSIFHELGKNIPNFLKRPQPRNDTGFPQNVSMLWEFGHSQTLGIVWVWLCINWVYDMACPGIPKVGKLANPQYLRRIDYCYDLLPTG